MHFESALFFFMHYVSLTSSQTVIVNRFFAKTISNNFNNYYRAVSNHAFHTYVNMQGVDNVIPIMK